MMNREFTRKELYDLVWSQPMRSVAADVGISDVALAKHCKKANIPVPGRGYWARKQAGQSTVQAALPPRFFGAADRVGGERHEYYRYGSDWAEALLQAIIPPIPTFDEDMAAVKQRARTLVGKIRCLRQFEPAHPLVAKLLAHEEERRQDAIKWQSRDFVAKYETGIERLLIINTLFLAAARVGCRPAMRTSKYDFGNERNLGLDVGESYVPFTVETVASKKEQKKARLQLAFGRARERGGDSRVWEDGDDARLEDQLAEVLVQMLVAAETQYRDHLREKRERLIEGKAEAEAELQRRKDEAEREARALAEKQARERIARLLAQAKNLARANEIRAYVEATLLRMGEITASPEDLGHWAVWARQEADRIDPVRNGTVDAAIRAHMQRVDHPVP